MNWKTNYQKWNEFDNLLPTLKAELATLDEKTLEDAFYTTLDFGTAGMRGVLGVGTNRMNIYTIRKANDGFARFIAEGGDAAKKAGIVIAYDTRHMSLEFAKESAAVMAGYGIKAYLFEKPSPTPELSFAVRHLKAAAGIVITASHNPKEYNGYKIYDKNGCQVLPDDAAKVVAKVNEVADELQLTPPSFDEMLAAGLIEYIGQAIDDVYVENIAKHVTFADVPKDDVIAVYTSLHGTGYRMAKQTFDTMGYTNIHYVTEQVKPDSDFSTAPYPNPEDKSVFALSEKLGNEVGADILLATDPDADRLGIAIKKASGGYELLNGNVTGGLMTYYILDRLKETGNLPSNGVIFTTVVTSDFAENVANMYGIETERTLTGFKFIGDRVEEYTNSGEKQFLYGFEESYGSLVNSDIARDKDAIQAVVVLTEMAAYYKAQGKSLLDVLVELEEKLGVFAEGLENIALAGIEGAAQIAQIIKYVSMHPFEEVAGLKVVGFENYITSTKVFEGKESIITLPKSDVLKFYLEDGSWFCFRPSGTEPKAKIYIAIRGENKAKVDAKMQEISKELLAAVEKIIA